MFNHEKSLSSKWRLYQLTARDGGCAVVGPFSAVTGHIFHPPFSHLAVSPVPQDVTELSVANRCSPTCTNRSPWSCTGAQNVSLEHVKPLVSAAAQSRGCAGFLLCSRGESAGAVRNCRFCFLSCHSSNIWPSATLPLSSHPSSLCPCI